MRIRPMTNSSCASAGKEKQPTISKDMASNSILRDITLSCRWQKETSAGNQSCLTSPMSIVTRHAGRCGNKRRHRNLRLDAPSFSCGEEKRGAKRQLHNPIICVILSYMKLIAQVKLLPDDE